LSVAVIPGPATGRNPESSIFLDRSSAGALLWIPGSVLRTAPK
jgi:hypothetical protein